MHPFIQITDSLVLPTYLFILSITYTLAVLWVYVQAPKNNFDRTMALDFCLMIMLGGFVGARLTHILYENPNYYMKFPLDMFKVWQGGFVFFGGFFGALLATSYYAMKKQQHYGLWADFFAPVFPVGYAMGRLGCFFNGCCYGATCDLAWAVEFTHPGLPSGLRHPTQLYAVGWELLVSLPAVFLAQRYLNKQNKGVQKYLGGMVFVCWIIAHCLGRLGMEFFRDDYRGSMPFGVSISTWLSIALLMAACFWIYRRRPRA